MLTAIFVALIGVFGTISAALIVAHKGVTHRLDEIHVLVNSRLAAALAEVADLKTHIEGLKDVIAASTKKSRKEV